MDRLVLAVAISAPGDRDIFSKVLTLGAYLGAVYCSSRPVGARNRGFVGVFPDAICPPGARK